MKMGDEYEIYGSKMANGRPDPNIFLSEQIGAQRALLASDAQHRINQQALFDQISVQTAEADIWQRLDRLRQR
jgi:hypothetical protein